MSLWGWIVAGVVTLIVGGVGWWRIRAAGQADQKQKQIKETLDEIDRIEQERAEAGREVDEALGDADYRDKLKRLYDAAFKPR